MAIVLKFKQGDSGTELNLMSGASNGFQLSGNGWSPVIMQPTEYGEPQPLVETIQLRLKHSSQDNLASSLQSLHEMQTLATKYVNTQSSVVPVWLHAKMANETGERRSLVRSISIQFGSSWFGAEATSQDIPITLVVVREPYWESTTARNLPEYVPGATTNFVEIYDYTAAGSVVSAHDIVGDTGARIQFMATRPFSDDWVKQIWMGVRSANKHGASGITNFEHIWEIEDGSNEYGTDVIDTVDSTASGGYTVRITENSWNWDKSGLGTGIYRDAVELRLSDVTANYADQRGKFLWLIRAKVGASSVWELQIDYSYNSWYRYVRAPIVEIDNTANYEWHEVATIPMGLRDHHALSYADLDDDWEQQFGVFIRARRTSGSNDLYMDCFALVPVDEGFVTVDGSDGAGGAGWGAILSGRGPDGMMKSVVDVSNSVYTMRGIFNEPWQTNDVNFHLPPGDGRIYCVYDSTDAQSQKICFNEDDVGRYYERWLSLRGSE